MCNDTKSANCLNQIDPLEKNKIEKNAVYKEFTNES